MDQRTFEQLEKVLALADSSHDGEAINALRKARQMLSRDGLSFGDLARIAARPRFNPMSLFAAGNTTQLETQIIHMRQQLQDAKIDLQAQDIQLDFWRRRAGDL